MPDAPPSPPEPPGAHGLLAGKTVLVAAAAGTAIGIPPPQRCAEEGAQGEPSAPHERRSGEAGQEQGSDPVVAAIPCNVTDEAQVQALSDRASSATGGLDVVVNIAGLGGTATHVDKTVEQWLTVLDVTLNRPFRCM